MNHKKIVFVKILFLSYVIIHTLLNSPENIGSETPPLFIYPIVMLFVFVFTFLFFKGILKNKNITPGNFGTFSFKIFQDPLPFYHLCAYSAIAKGGFGLLNSIIRSEKMDPVSLFALSAGLPFLINVILANKKIKKE